MILLENGLVTNTIVQTKGCGLPVRFCYFVKNF